MASKTDNFKKSGKLLLLSLVTGLFGGVVGAVFSLLISFVTDLRLKNGWLICLMPVLAVLIVLIYKMLGIFGMNTNDTLTAIHSKNRLSHRLSIGIFSTSVISHLVGASVGREGAALQIGGGIAAYLAKKTALSDDDSKILIRAGLAAVFAAVFGTPITAFLFALEVAIVGKIHLKSVLPSLLASFSAYGTALLIGIHPERFLLKSTPNFSVNILWKVAVLTLACAVLSFVFCHALHIFEKYSQKAFKNPYLRIILGGVLLVLLTIFVGNQSYNGAGIGIIEDIFKTASLPAALRFAFLVKILFTCISLAAGFKGGEIVPTLFIGATFGAAVASLLGLSIPFGAALSMVLLFCGVTNCPLASVALSFELFSGAGFWYFVPAVAVVFIISGKASLYHAQKRAKKLTFKNIFKGEL